MNAFLRSLLSKLFRAISRSAIGGRINQVIAESLMGNRRDVVHGGVRLSFVVPNYLNSWRVKTFSSKEPETLEWVDSFTREATLWDIGANVGLYSCYAALRKGCRVYAFEPSVFNLELLARNVWINGLCERVTLIPLPLTDRLSNSTLNMTNTEWGGAMSTFDRPYTHDGSALKKEFEFRTVGISMDEAVAILGLQQPDYIKLDVDGIEHLILKGGAVVLQKVKSVLIEINEEFEKQIVDSTRYLTEAGLVLKEKRHAAIFDATPFKNCYNQIWHRSSI